MNKQEKPTNNSEKEQNKNTAKPQTQSGNANNKKPINATKNTKSTNNTTKSTNNTTKSTDNNTKSTDKNTKSTDKNNKQKFLMFIKNNARLILQVLIIGFIFCVIILGAIIFSSDDKDKVNSLDKTTSKTKATPKKPELPEVYWTELNQQLLALEQEYNSILNVIIPKSTRSDELGELPSSIQYQSKPESFEGLPENLPTTAKNLEITWTVVGNKLIELEQQRETTITSLNTDN